MPVRRPKIGVLGLTLELYETLAPALRPSREQWVRRAVVPALSGFADVLFEGAAFTRETAEAHVAHFEAAGADALIVMLLSYSPSQLVLPALKRTRLPILVWNTQELWSVGEGFTGGEMTDNHGVHGTQDLSNVLTRAGVPYEYVTSHLRDAQALDALKDFVLAAAAARRLSGARLGLMGHAFPGMGDFALDTTGLAATLGCQWVNVPVQDYVDSAAAAPTDAVRGLVGQYRVLYDVAADVTPFDLEQTARTEWALRAIVERDRLDALTYLFSALGDEPRTPTVPFVAISRLMGEGLAFGGEGDLISCAGHLLLGSLAPPAGFTEMFTIDFEGSAVFLSHMGEANVAMARSDRKTILMARPAPITRTRGRQLALVTVPRPGPATLSALTLGPGQQWRLIVGRLRIEEFGPLPAMPVPHFKAVPEGGGVREFLTRYAKAGGPHHSAICFGDARERLRQAGRLLGAEYCEV